MKDVPDRIRVGFCRKCGALGPSLKAGDAHGSMCFNCPGNEPLVFVRYQLTKRTATIKPRRSR